MERVACPECDLIVQVGDLEEGEQARCPRCRHLLSQRTANALERALAFALAAVVLLILANSFPFLALSASGLESEMTLPRAVLQLYREGYWAVGLLVLGVIVVVPAVMLTLMIGLVISINGDHRARWHVAAGRLLFSLTPWSMAEVFVIAVLVSLVKIASLATVFMHFAFWSYVAFAICFTIAISSIDRFSIWREIERLRP